MKNFIQQGDTIEVLAPYDVTSGGGALVGDLFGVAVTDAASGAKLQLKTTGVFDLAKTSAQAWTPGVVIYWDNTTKKATTTATSNKVIGVALLDAANPSASGRVRLNGAFGL
ncbi:DUF2190 family protein [Arvimicrobium flavum]|uniref:DUF2190 family protein n=1 Tax=Arvimicrobium flavum TaxID=3393320 RepID=UPI00237BCF87|nr:capsid cement protein [Mesorhizobium shangrilense]